MSVPQSYENHTRWFPLVHFILFPLLLLLLILAIIELVRSFDLQSAMFLLIVIILVLLNLAARLQPLRAQDRTIKLEERLRYSEILDDELYERSKSLRTSQIIALRFASDEELPELVTKVVSGELTESSDIKRAIKNWRGDYLRV